MEAGLQLDKVYKIIKFNQSPWLRSYISLNIEKGKHAVTDFHKDFYKLMNSSVFARGDKGISPLDSACREHDLAYDRSNSVTDRNKANILENRAWERFQTKDANFKKKASPWTITTAMKTKRKLDAGCGFKAAVK
ncbi:Hypothetical protein CINCED_3A010332 [Cinara cedri]|uniref:Uncharacterized protein n=1 Tax=Cinara cedri TaxID=506608 RepID=A0A5E4M7J8_9HEMI|nr:Hypothetical protein CINCED_3A010332 [Cinara cedri]